MIRIKILIIVLFMPTISLLAQEESVPLEKDEVKVYYFHNERRCATCMAVEKVTKEIVKDLYKGKVDYIVYNLDGERGKTAALKLGIAMQSVLVVKGDKIINLTTDSFRFARNKPEKLRGILKDNIDSLL